MSIPALATEANASDSDNILEIASKTFPEYAEKLNGNHGSRNRAMYSLDEEMNIAQRETRPVDEDGMITYTEYDNGIITLGMARFKPSTQLIVGNTESSSTHTKYTATIIASVIDGPTLTVNNVQYSIYPAAYDRVNSAGSYSIPGYSTSQITCNMNNVETASRPAFATYSFACPVGMSTYSGAVCLKVANDNASVTFDIW